MSFGLPLLPSSVSVFGGTLQLVADAVAAFFGLFPQEWGIFLDGEPVVLADNVVTMSFRSDWRISRYPQEAGAFADYNKTAEPFTAKLRFSAGDSLSNRQSFIDSIAAIAGDTNLYDVVTPEAIYQSCNIVHYDYDRTAEKAGLIEVDVWVEEVRVTGGPSFSSTKTPGASSNVDNGVVQGATVTRGPDLAAVT